MPRQIPSALPLETAWGRDEKPLPQLPSPTLTNPDYILPSSMPKVASPPRVTRRPPSPSYLRDKSGEDPRMAVMGKKEKLGLMSRKMMLLRSRTASGNHVGVSGASRGSPSQGSMGDSEFIPSSPVLQDVGNLAPEQPEFLQLPELDRRSASGGSSSSDVSEMKAFLARYGQKDGSSDDETLLHENEDGGGAPAEDEDNNTEVDSELSEERRKQQIEEYNSAILSKRAEQILANAKKRLNVMEGNLRGARDLVAPLTAANLKRATSLGSAQYVLAQPRRYVTNGYDYDESGQSARILQAQASSPTMGRDYYSHARGFSETELPERSQTALDHPYDAYHAMNRNVRTAAQRSNETSNLRSTRSYDTLGAYGVGRHPPVHARDSPDSGASGYLEPLREDDEARRSFHNSGAAPTNNGLGIYRPSSRTSDLREQMSSLKGKISSLKERAREESLRRQSETNLRHASPLNNAMANAPEFYYTSSSGYSSPVLDTNAGVGQASTSNSPASAHFPNTALESRTGSRNAFAEQAARDIQRTPSAEFIKPPKSRHHVRQDTDSTGTSHRRTPIGTAIVGSAKNRYSHHQQSPSQDMPGAFIDDEEDDEAYLEVPSPGLSSEHYPNSSHSSGGSSHPRVSPHIDDDYSPSEDGTSVYEDAKNDQASAVAHEDREDAFDYQHFFLHSAMGTYSNGRRGSDSSDASVTSDQTAKGPRHEENEYEDEEDFDTRTAEFPPATPETPEKLREIEANLHKRSFSEESISTLATYATADEDISSPVQELDRRLSPPVLSPTYPSERRRPYAPATTIPGSSSRPSSRPSTAVGHSSRPSTAVNTTTTNRAFPLSDTSSDRADSGVGLPRRAIPPPGSMTPKARKQVSNTTSVITPPTSPRVVHQDPAAVAVSALLDAAAPPLGLRNKAVLFSVVESLRKVVKQLQELDETSYDSRELRGRLDEAKFMLDGRGEQ